MKSLFTKDRIWKDAKSIVFGKMDQDIMSPERADEILDYVKKFATNIESPDLARQFYRFLGERFTELRDMEIRLRIEEDEENDRVVAHLVDYFMKQGEVDHAESIMEMSEKYDDMSILVEQLKGKYAKEFEFLKNAHR